MYGMSKDMERMLKQISNELNNSSKDELNDKVNGL